MGPHFHWITLDAYCPISAVSGPIFPGPCRTRGAIPREGRLMMSRFAAAFFVFFLALAVPALAQAPDAAPTGAPAQTEVLTPPPGVIDASGGGDSTMIGSIPIVAMFRHADIVVQAVMVFLLLASLWSWTLIFNKATAMAGLKRKARKFEKVFWSGQSLDELYQQFGAANDHPMTAMFIAASREAPR